MDVLQDTRAVRRAVAFALSSHGSLLSCASSDAELRGSFVQGGRIALNELAQELGAFDFVRFVNTNVLPLVNPEGGVSEVVYVSAIIARETSNGFFPLLMGLQCVFDYAEEYNGLKVSCITADLDYAKGNTAFIPQLRLAEKRRHLRAVVGGRIAASRTPQEAVYIFALACDMQDEGLMASVTSSDFSLVEKGQTACDSPSELPWVVRAHNIQDASRMHALCLERVEESGEKALVVAQRVQLNRTKSRLYAKATKYRIYRNTTLEFDLVRAGGWKVRSVKVTSKLSEDSFDDPTPYYEF